MVARSCSSTEAAATFECSLDGASWSTCSSPQEYSLLSDGAHQVQVRARDALAAYGEA